MNLIIQNQVKPHQKKNNRHYATSYMSAQYTVNEYIFRHIVKVSMCSFIY
jgi:hypothetical protein